MNNTNSENTYKAENTIKDYLINSVTGTFPLNEKFPFEQFDWTKATILNPTENLLNNMPQNQTQDASMLDAYIVVINNYGKLLTAIMKSQEVNGLNESKELTIVGIYSLSSLTYMPAPPMQELISLPENARVEYLLNNLNFSKVQLQKQTLN